MASNQYYWMSCSCIVYIEIHSIESFVRDLTFLPHLLKIQVLWDVTLCHQELLVPWHGTASQKM